MAGLGADGLGHDVDENETGEGAVWHAEDRHALLAVDPLQHRSRRNCERILAVLTDNRCLIVRRLANREGHRAQRRVEEAWRRFFERDRLHPLKQIRLAELIGMKPRGSLSLTDEHGVDLLT